MLSLAIANQPLCKYLTRISLSFVLKSWRGPRDGKNGRFPEGQTRDRERDTSIHIPFGIARQKGVFARPATAWAARRKQSICQKRLFGFFDGVDSSSDVITSLRNNRTEDTRPSPTGTVHQPHDAEAGAEVALRNSSGAPGEARVESRLLEFALLRSHSSSR